jgi:hypothetical protein
MWEEAMVEDISVVVDVGTEGWTFVEGKCGPWSFMRFRRF